jgi:hypothetical protein
MTSGIRSWSIDMKLLDPLYASRTVNEMITTWLNWLLHVNTSAELIQAGDNTLHSEIHIHVNWIRNKEELPEQWKEPIVVPIHTQGDKTVVISYRGISLLSTTYKIVSNILLSRLTPWVDEMFGYRRCGFQHNRSNTDQIFCIRQVLEKQWEYNGTVHQLFIDLKKACDSVRMYYTAFSLNLVCQRNYLF